MLQWVNTYTSWVSKKIWVHPGIPMVEGENGVLKVVLGSPHAQCSMGNPILSYT